VVMQRLGYCCGRKYVFHPQTLCCYGKQLCTINRDQFYYSYENRYVIFTSLFCLWVSFKCCRYVYCVSMVLQICGLYVYCVADMCTVCLLCCRYVCVYCVADMCTVCLLCCRYVYCVSIVLQICVLCVYCVARYVYCVYCVAGMCTVRNALTKYRQTL